MPRNAPFFMTYCSEIGLKEYKEKEKPLFLVIGVRILAASLKGHVQRIKGLSEKLARFVHRTRF